MEFVRQRDIEFSNGRVLRATVIAAALCPNEQLLNRLTVKGEEG
jgi:hypothetical protein